jgi:C4-dicarboxylate-specific signal transduction histidine kinase
VPRPLREQFAVATLLLLIPVGAVITWAARETYRGQVVELQRESHRLAYAVAAHVDAVAELGPVDAAQLNPFLDRIPLPPGAFLTITDERQQVITSRNSQGRSVEEHAEGIAIAGRGPWTVTVGIPTSEAARRTAPIYQQTVLISGVAMLMMFAIQVVFVRRWLRSLVALERTADRVGRGDLSPLPPMPMPSRELEHLRDAFADMVEKLRAAREAIARQIEEERRMREELESLHLQVIRQERLAAIGLLLSGIAHELNNPLQVVSGFAELLQRNADLQPEIRADLQIIQKESRRASGIIRNLSRFGRQQSLTPVPVELGDVIGSVLELRQRRLQELGVVLDIEDAATHPVSAVFAELQQVLLNFVVNAEQAIAGNPPESRRIIVRTADEDDRVRLEVEDAGPGVKPEDEAKLFQPFFTTKPIGEGTGLGLSVSYGIVKTYGGTIGYRRAASGGAIFFFVLPRRTEDTDVVLRRPDRPATEEKIPEDATDD